MYELSIFAHAYAHLVTVVQQQKKGLQGVVAVGAPTGNMQEQVDFTGRRVGNECHGRYCKACPNISGMLVRVKVYSRIMRPWPSCSGRWLGSPMACCKLTSWNLEILSASFMMTHCTPSVQGGAVNEPL